MLKRIKIENLRGIREGEIDGLTRLVVLVGPNGCGKSTVLEGAFIGGARDAAEAVGIVTQRRTHTWNGARWVVRGGDRRLSAKVDVEWHDGSRTERTITWDAVLQDSDAIKHFSEIRSSGPYSDFLIIDGGNLIGRTAMAANNDYQARQIYRDPRIPSMRLVDPTAGQSLHDLFTQAVKAGRRDEFFESAKSVVPDLGNIEILTEDNEPRLCFTFRTGSAFVVPVSLAGDGIHALLRMAFELASPDGGTILLEEPEVHMHPRALSSCAKAIVAAVRRGVQVIMATHSLELIDRLLSELTDDEVVDPGLMTLQKLALRDGALTAVSIPASDAEQSRTSVEEDLR
jgi:AAA domain, putative AbiEii toxin, Type IV TA system/AAA domain